MFFNSSAKVAKNPELDIVLYIKFGFIGAIRTFCVKLTEKMSNMSACACHVCQVLSKWQKSIKSFISMLKWDKLSLFHN